MRHVKNIQHTYKKGNARVFLLLKLLEPLEKQWWSGTVRVSFFKLLVEVNTGTNFVDGLWQYFFQDP